MWMYKQYMLAVCPSWWFLPLHIFFFIFSHIVHLSVSASIFFFFLLQVVFVVVVVFRFFFFLLWFFVFLFLFFLFVFFVLQGSHLKAFFPSSFVTIFNFLFLYTLLCYMSHCFIFALLSLSITSRHKINYTSNQYFMYWLHLKK